MPRTADGYHVRQRADTGSWQINGPDPRYPTSHPRHYYRGTVAATSEREAQRKADRLHDDHEKEARHGPKLGTRSFTQAADEYLRTIKPNAQMRRLIERIVGTRVQGGLFGDLPLGEIKQSKVNELGVRMLGAGANASNATMLRSVIMPVRAIMRYVADYEGWCARPIFKTPEQPKGKTNFLMPEEAQRLLDACQKSEVRSLLLFYIGTGARHSEALRLDWHDVDLVGGTCWLRETKNGKDRFVELPPVVIEALQLTPPQRRQGAVFLHRGKPYKVYISAKKGDREQAGGVENALRATLKAAGITSISCVHDLRHTWATWHYAIWKDPFKLRDDGCWSSTALVERYAHRMPMGQENVIRTFLYGSDTPSVEERASALKLRVV